MERSQSSLIGILIRARAFMRATATVVALSFTMLVLAPSAAAARQALAAPVADVPQLDNAQAQLARTVLRIRRLLDSARPGQAKSQQGELASLAAQLRNLDKTLSDKLTETGERLKKKGLPEKILARQTALVQIYRQRLDTLEAQLDAIRAAGSEDELTRRIAQARAGLDALKLQRARQPFDPKHLPNISHGPEGVPPPRSQAWQFETAGLGDNPRIQLAALGDFRFDQLPGASDPAYLAETPEVVLNDAIRAKAAELDYDALKIYRWVRNNVEWIPSWGALQQADITLSSRRGNAMDIASLTIALLRASGIPARYVHGTVEVPEAQFRNWAGGFKDITAAANFAASGGIPTGTELDGGQITGVRMEHVWVEAAIDFHPSQGAVNRSADSWIALDPSYKQYDYLQGLDVVSIAGIDPQKLADQFAASGTVNETEGWVSGLDPTILENAQTQAQQALETYISDNLPNPTVGDVIGGRKTIIQDAPVLPAGLPYRPLVVGARYASLPNALRHRLEIGFGTGSSAMPDEPVVLDWSRVNNHKLTLSFRAATSADEQALQSLLPDGQITDASQLPQSIPAYLVQVVPELRLDGKLVKSGAPMALGEDLNLNYTLIDPTRGSVRFNSPVVAGSYLSIGTAGGAISPAVLDALKARVKATKSTLESQNPDLIGALTREDMLGDLFYAGSLGYFAEYAGLAYLAGLGQGLHHELAPSIGTYGYVPSVDYFFGFPLEISPGGIEMDMDQVARFNGGDGYTPDVRKAFNIETGVLASALEHTIPEQMFVTADNPGEAISAVKAVGKATTLGQRIYEITADNQAETLPNIRHDSGTMAEIRSALNVGMDVITHADSVSVPGWSGSGYIILDPLTGDGAYKISNGENGGFYFAGVLLGAAFLLLTMAFTAAWFIDPIVNVVVVAGMLSIVTFVSIMVTLEQVLDPNQKLANQCFAAGFFTSAGWLLNRVSGYIPDNLVKVLEQAFGVPIFSYWIVVGFKECVANETKK